MDVGSFLSSAELTYQSWAFVHHLLTGGDEQLEVFERLWEELAANIDSSSET